MHQSFLGVLRLRCMKARSQPPARRALAGQKTAVDDQFSPGDK
jgi:hypothetical protein